jgi:predicted acetylornithine/succinylornithine family transaminase
MKPDMVKKLDEKYIVHTYKRLPLVLVKGKGTKVWDSEGREYLDFLAGIAVNGLGHCHPKVVGAIRAQAEQLMHISNLYYIEPQAKLAQLLAENSFGDKSFFCNSGAEANEAAIKLARKYGEGQRYEIICMEGSFHGRTLATLTATGQEKYRKGYTPLVPGFQIVSFNDLDKIKEAINNRTVAVMLEPIQGEGGINVARDEYLPGIRKLCDENNLLLILDEVQCGMGRTGKLFSYEHYGVEPDIMTLAKSLGGGFPIASMITKEKVASFFSPGDHASTFGGNPLACRAAIAAVKAILEEDLIENAKYQGKYFMDQLRGLQQKHPAIKEIRGKGLMIGMELAFEEKDIVTKCQKKGLLINAIRDKILRFLPPLIVTREEIDKAVNILDEVLGERE